jgi:hypothetical protein
VACRSTTSESPLSLSISPSFSVWPVSHIIKLTSSSHPPRLLLSRQPTPVVPVILTDNSISSNTNDYAANSTASPVTPVINNYNQSVVSPSSHETRGPSFSETRDPSTAGAHASPKDLAKISKSERTSSLPSEATILVAQHADFSVLSALSRISLTRLDKRAKSISKILKQEGKDETKHLEMYVLFLSLAQLDDVVSLSLRNDVVLTNVSPLWSIPSQGYQGALSTAKEPTRLCRR